MVVTVSGGRFDRTLHRKDYARTCHDRRVVAPNVELGRTGWPSIAAPNLNWLRMVLKEETPATTVAHHQVDRFFHRSEACGVLRFH